MNSVILESDFYTEVNIFVPEILPFKTKKIDLNALKNYLEKVYEDEDIMNETKQKQSMSSEYRVKLGDKWSPSRKDLQEYHSGMVSDYWQVHPYWNEINKHDFSILHGTYHTPAQFKIEIEGDFYTRKLSFDKPNSQILFQGKEFTLIEPGKWAFSEYGNYGGDFEGGYFGDNRLIYIFKKDKKGFPCLLTEVK